MPQCGASINVYVDDSNIWIGGRNHPSRHSKWDYNIKLLRLLITHELPNDGTDPCLRTKLHIYGANIHRKRQLYNLWDHSYVEPVFCPRNSKGKEKQADTELTKDMSHRVMTAHQRGEPAFFIVLSGDADMVPVVKMAADHRFFVYVWSWKNSLSPQLQNLTRDPYYQGFVHVRYLDRHLGYLKLK